MMSERHEKKGSAEAATSPARGSNNPDQESAVNEAKDTPTSVEDASSDVVSVEELAAIDFEASEGRPEEAGIYTNEQWAQFGVDFLPTVRLANLFMFRSKAEIVGFVEVEPDAHMRIAEDIRAGVEVLQSYVDLLEDVEARLMIGLAVHGLAATERQS